MRRSDPTPRSAGASTPSTCPAAAPGSAARGRPLWPPEKPSRAGRSTSSTSTSRSRATRARGPSPAGARSSVIFVWNMTGYMSRVPLWNAMYPGDRVVDWLAWDPYGKTPDNPIAAPVVPFPTALGQDKGRRPDTTGAYRFYKWADGPGAAAWPTGVVYRKPGAHKKPLMVAEFSVCWASSTLAQAQRW